jgi:hypothetical protein
MAVEFEGELRKNEVAANSYTMTATKIYVIPLAEGASISASAGRSERERSRSKWQCCSKSRSTEA